MKTQDAVLDAPAGRAVDRAGRQYAISAATNLMRVLLALGEFDALTLQQAAETAEVSKSTAYRLLRTLEGFGMVERISGGGGYRLGREAIRWAQSIERHQGVHGVTDPVMRELHAITGDLTGVVLLSETGLTWVGGLAGPVNEPHEMLFETHADRVVPLHASGSGRAIAAHLPPDRLGGLLGPEPYRPFTAATPVTWRQLRPLLDESRSLGYAVDRGQVHVETFGVAAPFFAGDQVVGAISVAWTPDGREEEHIAAVAPAVRLAADRISSRLTPLRDQLAPEWLRPHPA